MSNLNETDRGNTLLSENERLRARLAAAEKALSLAQRKIEGGSSKDNELLKLHIDRMPVAHIVFGSDFRVQSWNPAAERIFGYTAEEAVGMMGLELVPDEIKPKIGDVWSRLLTGDETAHSINENVTKDGRIIACAWSNTPLKDYKGNVTGVLSMVQDITGERRTDEMLRETTQRLKGVLEAAPLAIFCLDPDGRVMDFWNPAAEAMFGWTEAEVLGKLLPIVPEEDIPQFHEYVKETLEGRPLRDVELRRRKKDGSPVDILISNSLLKDKEGAVYGSVSMVLDITGKKRAEENIRRLNRVYSVLSSVGRLVARAKDQETLFKETCRILVDEGLFLMAWVGLADEASRAVRSVACSGCDEGYLEKARISIGGPEGEGPTGTAVRTARPVINNDTEHNPVMQPWRDEAIKRGYLSSAAFPLVFGYGAIGAITVYAAERGFFDEEEVQLLEGLAADISYALRSMEQEKMREAAEEAAAELNERLRSLVEEAEVGAFILRDERVVYANPRAYGIFGYEHGETPGILDLVHPDDREKAVGIYTEMIKGDIQHHHMEIRGLKKDGHPVDIEVFGFSSRFKGGPAIVGSVLDITERKDLERHRRDFIAMVTHDLKSPLSAIMGYAELMLSMKEKYDADTQKMVGGIISNGKKLLSMADDFLTVSKMETGPMHLSLQPEDMSEILEEAVEAFAAIAEKKGIALKTDIGPLPVMLLDRSYMERVIGNLLQNAFKYTGWGGSVMIRAEVGRRGNGRRSGGEFIAVSITDTGPGIPREEQVKVFDRYFRSWNAAGIRGAGLGLAIVKAVTEAHGGRVAIESSEGQGSTFKIFLPVRAR